MAGACEGIYYAKSVGLDVKTVFNAVKEGSASSTQLLKNIPAILDKDVYKRQK